jgi:hypothetical protein
MMSGISYDSFSAGYSSDNSYRDRGSLDNWENSLDTHEMADYHHCHCIDHLVAAQPVNKTFILFLSTSRSHFYRS